MQLVQTTNLISILRKEAEKQLKKVRVNREHLEIDQSLSHEPNGSNMLCPFCQYSSKKNKRSAFIRNDFFKCMACGIARRVR